MLLSSLHKICFSRVFMLMSSLFASVESLDVNG